MQETQQLPVEQQSEVPVVKGGALTIGQKMYIDRYVKSQKKELHSIFSEYTKDVAKSHNDFRQSTMDEMNKALDNINKRFSNMYGTLINKFLVVQEQKVFAAELACQVIIERTAELFYATRTNVDQTLEDFKTEYQKQIENRMEQLAEALKNDAIAKQKAASEAAQQEAAQPQETKADVAVQEEAKA
jgi:chloramphenicol O-acetyltransferase